MPTYQYNDTSVIPEGDTGTTKWVAAPNEAVADTFAVFHGWDECGGEIWTEMLTREMIHAGGMGIDVVLSANGNVVRRFHPKD